MLKMKTSVSEYLHTWHCIFGHMTLSDPHPHPLRFHPRYRKKLNFLSCTSFANELHKGLIRLLHKTECFVFFILWEIGYIFSPWDVTQLLERDWSFSRKQLVLTGKPAIPSREHQGWSNQSRIKYQSSLLLGKAAILISARELIFRVSK